MNRCVGRSAFTVYSVLGGVLVLLACAGCAVSMALEQPENKDLSVLTPGNSRGAVIAVMGPPKWTEEENGFRTDVFTFKEGSGRLVKLLRAGFHLSADVFTFGLWEPFGMQFEKQFTSPEVSVQVYYDVKDRVKTAKVLSGHGVVLAKTFADSEPVAPKVPLSISVATILMPQPIADLPQRLAVSVPKGPHLQVIASGLDLALTYLRTFHPDMVIVEREALEPIAQELMLQHAGRVGDDTTVRPGGWKGADALLTLSVDQTPADRLQAVAEHGGEVSGAVELRLIQVETGLSLFRQTATASVRISPSALPGKSPDEVTEKARIETLRAALAYSMATLAAAFGDNPLGVVPDLSSRGAGIGVRGLLHGGAAHVSGLKDGDRILAVNDAPFLSVTQRINLPATLTVERGGKTRKEHIQSRS